jgi:hypothetical protein
MTQISAAKAKANNNSGVPVVKKTRITGTAAYTKTKKTVNNISKRIKAIQAQDSSTPKSKPVVPQSTRPAPLRRSLPSSVFTGKKSTANVNSAAKVQSTSRRSSAGSVATGRVKSLFKKSASPQKAFANRWKSKLTVG